MVVGEIKASSRGRMAVGENKSFQQGENGGGGK